MLHMLFGINKTQNNVIFFKLNTCLVAKKIKAALMGHSINLGVQGVIFYKNLIYFPFWEFSSLMN